MKSPPGYGSLFAVAAVAIGLIGVLSPAGYGGATGIPPRVAPVVESLARPVSHANLSVVFLRGREETPGRPFLTLQEGLKLGLVVVHETERVNELAIENRSERDLFVQAGEIVRGGKQDRLLATDLLVRPRSGRVPIESYCVEQGRWQARGAESVSGFSSSENYAPGNDIKIAAKQLRSQSGVWSGVAGAQEKLSSNVGQSVAARASASSLELTLDHEAIRKRTTSYVAALIKAIDDQPDAIGVAFAINGELYSADLYATRDLLRQLWPKLLNAAAVQAIAMQRDERAYPAPTPEQVRAFIDDAVRAAGTTKDLPGGVRIVTRETERQVRFETIDAKSADAVIHVNCLKKEGVQKTGAFESNSMQIIRPRR